MECRSLPQHGHQVLLRGGDGADVIVLGQIGEHVGGEKGGQGGAKADVLDAQVLQ